MTHYTKRALVLLLTLAMFSPSVLAETPSDKESIEDYSLDKLYTEISACYKSADFERAAKLYKRALVLIEKSGNKKALEEAQANYKKLVDRLAANKGTAQSTTTTASTASAATGTARPNPFSGFDIEKAKKKDSKSPSFQKSDWRKRLDQRSTEWKAYELDEQAHSYIKTGESAKALASMNEAVKAYADSSDIWYNKGLVEIHCGKYDDAIASFRKSLALKPDSSFKCQLRIAEANVESGNNGKAAEQLWKLRPEARNDYSTEREIDGLLVQACDDKAISNNSILANATERNLMLGIKNSSSSTKKSTLQDLCKQLQIRGRSASNETFMAYYLMKAELYEDALAAYKRADDYDASSKKGLLGIISMSSQLGKLEEVQAAKATYVERFPGDEKSKTYKEELSYYKDDFERTRAREKQPTSNHGDIRHFAQSEMPLKVYMPDVATTTSAWSDPADTSLDYDGILQRVMDEWTQASDNHVRFEKTQSADSANISIEWVGDKDKMDHSFAAGTTGYASNSSGKRRHNLKILAPKKGESSNAQSLYEVSLHEFGHALGLSHSSNSADIMYYSGAQGQSTLSENDRKRISELYNK